MAIVYYASVLMVSRYRDIIETNQPSMSRQPSILSTTSSVRNGRKKNTLILFGNNLSIRFIGSTNEAKTDTASDNSAIVTSSAPAEVAIDLDE